MDTDRRRGGWVSTLLALVVLVVVGFLCGALAGFLWEEPSLVLAYLSGRTEPVEWSEPGPVAAEPPPPAETAEVGAAGRAVRERAGAPRSEDADQAPPEKPQALTEFAPEAAAAPAPKPAASPPKLAPVTPKPVAAAPAKPAPPAAKPAPARVASVPEGRFSVQVGAFGDSGAADKLAAQLRARGYRSYVKKPAEEPGGSRWRVRVGPVDGRARAEDLAAKLKKSENLPTWILGEDES